MNQAPCNEGVHIEPARKPEKHIVAWEERGTSSNSSEFLPVPVKTSKAPRVLVVEDDTFFRRLNTEVLLHAGYTVDSAEDGASAYEALNANHYDLLVTDNSMPNVSGVELLRKLHAAQIVLPVIMATGAIPTEDLNHQPALQPVATLVKPYPINELVRVVKKVLTEVKPTTTSVSANDSQN